MVGDPRRKQQPEFHPHASTTAASIMRTGKVKPLPVAAAGMLARAGTVAKLWLKVSPHSSSTAG